MCPNKQEAVYWHLELVASLTRWKIDSQVSAFKEKHKTMSKKLRRLHYIHYIQ